MHAQVESKPQLEIFADDVKCTHGVQRSARSMTEALFYLRSRGIGESAARSLMVRAFASELLGEVKIDSLRGQMERILLDRLPHDGVIGEAV